MHSGMQPRCILPNTTWFVTRRTTRRHFLLRPDADGTIQQLYWFVTAVIAAKFGIELHAVQMLSTHFHEVLTDVNGELPRFLQQRNRLFANALKRHRSWSEEVFARGSPHCVALAGPLAIIKEITYTLANCVTAGLVDHPRNWPGVTVDVDDIGTRTIVVDRPDFYFDPDNDSWPETARISLSLPPALKETLGETRAKSMLREALASAIGKKRPLRKPAARIEQLTSIPHTHQSTSSESRHTRISHVAAGGDRDALRDAQRKRRTFLSAYYDALKRFTAGLRNILFPPGTWRMVREFGCRSLLSDPESYRDPLHFFEQNSLKSAQSVFGTEVEVLTNPSETVTGASPAPIFWRAHPTR